MRRLIGVERYVPNEEINTNLADWDLIAASTELLSNSYIISRKARVLFTQKKKMDGSKKLEYFVLVHGAGHGAWCWYKVATRLRSEGHRVTALDMAASGVNPIRVEELSSISDYCRPLMDFISALPPNERVVLVGHSMGGVCLSLAMESFPAKVSVAVFVTAFMPGPDFTLPSLVAQYEKQLGSYMDTHISFNNGDDKPPTSLLFGPEFLSSRMYQLSPPEDLTLAMSLMRPVGLYDEPDLIKETVVSKENYGSVRRVYVMCEEDYVLKQSFQKWMVESNPVDEVMLMSGADHMPMFSKSHELCAHLQDIVHRYC